MTASVEDVLVKRCGAAKDGGKYVAHVAYTDLYFAPGVIDKLKAEPATMKEVIDTMERVEGVLRVIPSYTLPEVHGTDDRLVRAARLSYMPDRSGDLFIMPKPYWLMSSAGTTHGTGYFYDERVPVLLFGAGIKPGKYWGAASPADLAPTLGALTRHHDGAPRRPRALGSARHAVRAAAHERARSRASLTQPSPSRERARFLQRERAEPFSHPLESLALRAIASWCAGCGVTRGHGRPAGCGCAGRRRIRGRRRRGSRSRCRRMRGRSG